MRKGFLNNAEKCGYANPETGKKCLRPKSTTLSKDQNPEGYCKYHYDEKRKGGDQENFNATCAICMDEGETEETGKMYPLSCTHRFHINCLSGMTQAVCPLCRQTAINLPKKVADKITENGKKYQEEKDEQDERDFQRMMEEEGGMLLQPVRLPPQIELMLALKYVVQLGIPVSLIPIETVLEIDPMSPLPAPGSIFQNTVRRLIENIQQRSADAIVEDDAVEGEEENEEIVLDMDSDDPFEFEGEDLQIVHRVRTVPSRDRNGIYYSPLDAIRAAAALFSTMSFQITDLPDITQEDLINLGMGDFTEEEN